MPNENYRDLIKRRMLEVGLTIPKLAVFVGVPSRRIWQYLQGKRIFGQQTMTRIAAALQINPTDISAAMPVEGRFDVSLEGELVGTIEYTKSYSGERERGGQYAMQYKHRSRKWREYRPGGISVLQAIEAKIASGDSSALAISPGDMKFYKP